MAGSGCSQRHTSSVASARVHGRAGARGQFPSVASAPASPLTPSMHQCASTAPPLASPHPTLRPPPRKGEGARGWGEGAAGGQSRALRPPASSSACPLSPPPRPCLHGYNAPPP
eukprot:100489-Chlamydomonas_euryale.AAC.1